MIKRIRLSFLLIISTMLLVFSPVLAEESKTQRPNPILGFYDTPVYANHKLINGVGNVTIYLNYASGIGYWESYISNAVNNWMYTGWANPIYINFVSSNYGSTIDIYRESDSYWPNYPDEIAASTEMYSSSSTAMNPLNGNWLYCEIHVNHDKLIQNTVSDFEAQFVMTHEMGHCFGLDHNTKTNVSIMWTYYDEAVVDTVQQVDNNTIIHLYGSN